MIILPGKNGDPDIVISCKRIKLKADTVPLIFPNLPNYLSDSKKLALNYKQTAISWHLQKQVVVIAYPRYYCLCRFPVSQEDKYRDK